MTDAVSPWERMEGEGDQAWEAFVTYRDMGGARSTAKVGQALSKSTALMNRWSGTHAWVARCEAWDAELDRERRAGHIEAVRSMAERHVTIAHAMLEKVVRRLQSLDPNELTPHQLARFARDAVTIERLALGEPTSVDPANGEGADDLAALGAAMAAWFERERTEAEAKAFMDGAAAASEVVSERDAT